MSNLSGKIHKTSKDNVNLKREGFQTFVKWDLYRIPTTFHTKSLESQAWQDWVPQLFHLKSPEILILMLQSFYSMLPEHSHKLLFLQNPQDFHASKVPQSFPSIVPQFLMLKNSHKFPPDIPLKFSRPQTCRRYLNSQPWKLSQKFPPISPKFSCL